MDLLGDLSTSDSHNATWMSYLRPSANVLPISLTAFTAQLRNCKPLSGWLPSIAVANSGGPDSTCLLFLMKEYIQAIPKDSTQPKLFSNIVSLSIDHDLQESSAAMSAIAERNAQSLNVDHLTLKVGWGAEIPFRRPDPGKPYERVAREARYATLFRGMEQKKTQILALAHHSDDQLETALIRIGRGSTEYGAGGMRRVRRWGMGNNDFYTYPHYALNYWMIRPLLEFSKDRILATCYEHKLDFAVDKSNFQPDLTIRNAIRHKIQNQADSNPPGLSEDMQTQLDKIDRGLRALTSVSVALDSGYHPLLTAVRSLSNRATDVENQVDSIINRFTLPSPPSTYLINTNSLSHIQNPSLRSALITRILRYVSFQLWGSLRAVANRRKSSLNMIIDKLWAGNPFKLNIKSFTAGGGVLWSPVIVRNGVVKMSLPEAEDISSLMSDEVGWIASRIVPIRAGNNLTDPSHPLKVDISEELVSRMRMTPRRIWELEYDNRFLVSVDLARFPERLVEDIRVQKGRVKIEPVRPWFIPRISWFPKEGAPVVLHNHCPDSPQAPLSQLQHPNSTSTSKPNSIIEAPWATIKFFRLLDQ